MQKALSQATGKGLDVNVAVANLALTIIDLQKDNKNAANAIQMLSQNLGQLMEAHNRLAAQFEKTCGPTQLEPPTPPNAS